jgi:mannose-1-phosphate guanylyltransferase
MYLKRAIVENNYENIKAIFDSLPDISIDYALMEKTSNIVMIKAEFFWDDLGSWTSLERIFTPDENGNIIQGKCITQKTSNCIIYNADTEKTTVATLGINDIVIAVADNIVLVMNKNESQNIKDLVNKYKNMD